MSRDDYQREHDSRFQRSSKLAVERADGGITALTKDPSIELAATPPIVDLAPESLEKDRGYKIEQILSTAAERSRISGIHRIVDWASDPFQRILGKRALHIRAQSKPY